MAIEPEKDPVPDPEEDELFRRIREGDPEARNALFTLVYQELHKLAARRLGPRAQQHTLGATGVVNEVFLRLLKSEQCYVDRTHFMAVAARCLRHVLVDYARRKKRGKRPPPEMRVGFEELLLSYEQNSIDVIALDQALTALARIDPEPAKLIELHFFGGQSVEECAAALDLSRTTAGRRLHNARRWLFHAMNGRSEAS